MNNVFKIRNLKCKYASNIKPVLEIDSLNIEEGSSTFFIGPSGVGKSTVLETLGVMNNTVFQAKKNDTIFEFRVNNSDHTSILKLWTLKESKIADFRNKHLSFIFQNTNLFNTLSAFDNIAITSILQGDSKKEAEYLATPMEGDIYTLKTENDYFTTYKVFDFTEDSLFIIPNEYETSEYSGIDEINIDENYGEFYYGIGRNKVKEMYDDNTIRNIER